MTSTGQVEDMCICLLVAEDLPGSVQNRVRRPGVVVQVAEGLLSMSEALDLIPSTTYTYTGYGGAQL